MSRRWQASAVALHRWVSLAALALWSLQVATGIFSVFHWEIDDATLAGEPAPLDLEAIERRSAALAGDGSGRRVESIWSSASGRGRFDLFLADATGAGAGVLRVDGGGRVLRARGPDESWSAGGWVQTLVVLHQSLLAGPAGRALIGTSGLVLLANLGLGLYLAWPRPGTWRRALLPGARPRGAARLYAWHRALGLWAALPAVALVAAGALLAFEERVERLLGPPALPAPQAPAAPAVPAGVGLAAASRAALARFPGAELSGIGFPADGSALWTIRLKQPDEGQRAYGRTRVWVSAVDGRSLAEFDPRGAPLSRRFLDHLFAFHTGEIGGLPGRLAALAVGGWLTLMGGLGARLWSVRRAGRTAAGVRGRPAGSRPEPT